MKFPKPVLLALMAAVMNSTALAGTPDGLQIISIAAEKAESHAAAISAYFDRFDHDPTASQCGNAQLNIGGVYIQKSKKGINRDLALSAVTSKKTRQQLGKLMTKFRDKNHDRGFDAALAYDVKGENVVFYGLSADIDTRVYSSTVAIVDLQNNSKVNAAICHALVKIPVLAEP